MNTTANTMDGFDVWFFGGTPGPNDHPQDCAWGVSAAPSIDEDDARIPAFAHHCNCGRPAATSRQAARPQVLALHF